MVLASSVMLASTVYPSDSLMEVQLGGIVTEVTCDCGEQFALDSPEEDQHYVWAVRRDGSRSMLGWCPKVRPFSVAVSKARASLTGVAMYRGKVC